MRTFCRFSLRPLQPASTKVLLALAVLLLVAFSGVRRPAPASAVDFPARLIRGSGGGYWTNCSPGTTIADPGGVRGLFVAGANQTNTAALEATILKYLPDDPTICGANLVIPWSSIDMGPSASPQYDWSFLDQAAAPWEAAGKIVNLIIWGTDESTKFEIAGIPATPAYVLSSTDTVACADGTLPVYWESGYQTPWRAFEAALVAHLNADANIGYIRFGLGTGGEDFPVDGFSDAACASAWAAKGMSATQWLDLSTSQIDYEATLGSTHPINIGINSLDGAPELPDQVAAEAVKYGMGFGMQGMTQTQIEDAENHKPCYASWCSLFGTYAGQVPLEVQPYTQSSPSGGGPTGALPPILDYVINQAHAQVLELYPQEWLVADDPSWPTYAAYHTAYAQALTQAAAAIGGAGTGLPLPLPRPGCHGSTCT
jgi:hypothetical protein